MELSQQVLEGLKEIDCRIKKEADRLIQLAEIHDLNYFELIDLIKNNADSYSFCEQLEELIKFKLLYRKMKLSKC